jgi:hypothetical protein
VSAEEIRPTALEIAVGTILGRLPAEPELPEPVSDPFAALEEAVTQALSRPPCLVSFSGGRDSSVVLSAATVAARRHDLPEPVPATILFQDSPGSREEAWQERVLAHLRLADWERIEITDELDLVGPYGSPVLRRHGVLYPPSMPLYALLSERAAGGSLLTGLGGDQVFGGWLYQRLGSVLRGSARPCRADAARAVHAASPRALRRAVRRRRAPRFPWLRPEGQRRFQELYARGADQHARTWQGHLRTIRRSRALNAATRAITKAGEDSSTLVLHPLLDPGFHAALGRAGGSTGMGDRTETMRTLFPGRLPDDVLARSDKAVYHQVYFRAASRAFARRFAGEGLDDRLVDPEALRAAWLSLVPPGSSALALQAAWLASEGASAPP